MSNRCQSEGLWYLMLICVVPLPSTTLQALHDVTMKPSSIYPYPVKHLISLLRREYDNMNWVIPDSKVHGANMGPTWVLSAPDGSRVSPMNLAIRRCLLHFRAIRSQLSWLQDLIKHNVRLLIGNWNKSCGFLSQVQTARSIPTNTSQDKCQGCRLGPAVNDIILTGLSSTLAVLLAANICALLIFTPFLYDENLCCHFDRPGRR